jgi:hypothetical protein
VSNQHVRPDFAMRLDAWRPERETVPEPVGPQVTIPLARYALLNRKVGFATGALECVLNSWSITDDLRIIIRDCLERLEEPE